MRLYRSFHDHKEQYGQKLIATPNIDSISVVQALKGGKLDQPREFLYWDYGRCRRRYDQVVRWKNWKGLRPGAGWRDPASRPEQLGGSRPGKGR